MNKIKYTGEVSIKVKTKPPIKVKNSGTDAFFNLLYELLANLISPQNQVGVIDRLPSKLQIIRNATIQSDNKYSPIKYESLLTTSGLNVADNRELLKDTTTGKECLQFTFYITNGYLNSTYATCREEIGKLLLLDNTNRILAHVDVDLTDFGTVYDDANGQAVIEWKLMFSNYDN